MKGKKRAVRKKQQWSHTLQLPASQCRQFIFELRALLYRDGPETEWDGDMLAELGALLNTYWIDGPEPEKYAPKAELVGRFQLRPDLDQKPEKMRAAQYALADVLDRLVRQEMPLKVDILWPGSHSAWMEGIKQRMGTGGFDITSRKGEPLIEPKAPTRVTPSWRRRKKRAR